MKAKQLTTKIVLPIAIITMACIMPVYGQQPNKQNIIESKTNGNLQQSGLSFDFGDIIGTYIDLFSNAAVGQMVDMIHGTEFTNEYPYDSDYNTDIKFFDEGCEIGINPQTIEKSLLSKNLKIKKIDGNPKNPKIKYEFSNINYNKASQINDSDFVNDSCIYLSIDLDKIDEFKHKYMDSFGRNAENNDYILSYTGFPEFQFRGFENYKRLLDVLYEKKFVIEKKEIKDDHVSFSASKKIGKASYIFRRTTYTQEYVIFINFTVNTKVMCEGYLGVTTIK